MTKEEIFSLALDTTKAEGPESAKSQGLDFRAALDAGFFGDYLNRELEALLEHELDKPEEVPK